MDIREPLKQFGLSENETEVYLATLSLGTATADTISKRAKILRTTTYEILKSLINKGLASHVKKDKKKYFEVADPKTLVRILEDKKNSLNKILPKLVKMKKSVVEKPVVELYEGKEGLKTILEDLIKNAKSEYKVIGNNTKFREVLKDYYADHFIVKRLKENIKCKFIAEPGKETGDLKKNDKKAKRVTKSIEELKDAKSEIFIYGDKVAIFTLVEEKPIGVTIKDKNIKALFEIIFDKSFEKIAK